MRLKRRNAWLVLRTLAIVIPILLVKAWALAYDLVFITPNNLFSGLVAANVFLMGFLLSGILADYKESEKIPGELAVSLSAIWDELMLLHDAGKTPEAKGGLTEVRDLTRAVDAWFHRRERTTALLDRIEKLHALFLRIEPAAPAALVARLKAETVALKRLVIRTDTIRDTSFISSAYLIASIVTGLLCVGLVFGKIEPYHEALFFTGAISFLMVYLLLLIHDLDNPFGYENRYSAENVSLYPLERFITEMERHSAERGLATT